MNCIGALMHFLLGQYSIGAVNHDMFKLCLKIEHRLNS